MALIHKATLLSSTVEVLTGWLPSRSWFRGKPVPQMMAGPVLKGGAQ